MNSRSIPFQIRFTLLFLCFFLPLILFSFFFYLQTDRIIRENLFNQTQDLLSSGMILLDGYVEASHIVAEELIYNTSLISYLEGQRGSIFEENLRLDIADTLSRYKNISYFTIASRGNRITLSNNGDLDREFAYDVQLHFLEEKKLRNPHPIQFHYFEMDRPYIYYLRDIYNMELSQVIGTLGLVIDISSLENQLNFQFAHYAPYLVLGNTEESRVLTESPFSSSLLEDYLRFKPGSSSGVFRDKRERLTLSYRSMNQPAWRLMLVLPDQEFYASLFKVQTYAVVVLILFLSFFSVLLIWVNRKISKPLKNLSEGIERFRKDPQPLKLLSVNADEFGVVTDQFNRMSRQLDLYINSELKEKIRVREAELKALQAQIKPHFLFNTLETINWIALMEGQETISEMILSLSSLMDAGMGRSTGNYGMEDEKIHLEKFLYLSRIRYEGKIDFRFFLPEAYRNYPVPPLMLQPLLENTITHCRQKSKEALFIDISLREEGDTLLLICRDNGDGIEPELRMELNRYFQTQQESWEGGDNRKSIGLMNVNLRIKLFYGAEYGLKIGECSEKGAVIVVTLPRHFSIEGQEEQ